MFDDDNVDTWFNLLEKSGRLKLSELKNPEDAGKGRDPNYCKYHRMLGHLTNNAIT